MRGLRTKLVDLANSISLCCYDIIVFAETWLTSDYNDAELGMINYNIFRKDRNCAATGKTRGGGVLIGVRKNIKAHVVGLIDECVGHEELWVNISAGSFKNLYLCAVYFPPQCRMVEYEFHCDTVENMSEECDKMYIMGDFNLPNLQFLEEENILPACNSNNAASDLLVSTLLFANCNQLNNVKNCNNVLLDLVFSNNDKTDVICPYDTLLPCDNHHPALLVGILEVNDYKPLQFEESIYDFKNANFYEINNVLLNINWDQLLINNIDLDLDCFYKIINYCLETFVPKILIRNNFKFPIWFSYELKQLTSEKKVAHKKFKESKLREDYLKFSDLRSMCKIRAKNDYTAYIQQVENSLKNDINAFWRYINSKNNWNDLPSVVKYNDTAFDDGNMIANAFANHFASVYEPPGAHILYESHLNFNSYFNVGSFYIKISEVLSKLEKLDVSKGSGPDNVPSIFLKSCAFSLSRPLWLLFNKSLNHGIFPVAWKLSYVVPIYKNNGDRNNVENYRPISLMSLIPKLFESIISDFLNSEFKNIIASQQHGFLQGRSITSNLLVYHEHIMDCLKSGFAMDAIYTDFAKAFDKLNISILLKKLYGYGVHGGLLEWLESYLSDRKQVVRIKGYLSEPIHVTSGVPQGAHLAPILFSIFLNDVVQCFEFCEFLMYADDIKIFLPITDYESSIKLQSDLTRFYDWCTDNKMTLNISKCKYIQFSKSKKKSFNNYHFNNNNLERVDMIKDLGVIFDSGFTFRQHTEICRNKAMKMLGFVKRHTMSFNDITAIKLLYVSLVRPHLENVSSVWSPYFITYQDMLDKVQRKFLRYIAYKMHIPMEEINYHQLESSLKIGSLKNRRETADIVFAHKLINGLCDCGELLFRLNFFVPPRLLRDQRTFELRQHRTLYGQNSAINRIMKICDNCEKDLFIVSQQSLKKYLKNRDCQ